MRDPEQIAREVAERIVPPAAALTATLSERRSDVEQATQIIFAAIREAIANDIARRQAEVTTWLRTDYKSVPMVVLEVMAKMGCDFNKPITEPE